MTQAQNLVFDCGFTPKRVYMYGYYTPASCYVVAEYDVENLGAGKQLYGQGYAQTSYRLNLYNFAEGGAGRLESINGSTVTFYYIGTYFTNLNVVAIG